MIATTDIANIVYDLCKDLDIAELYQEGNIPMGEVTTERIIVLVKPQTEERYWKPSFVEVNICIPDIEGIANRIRLGEVERFALKKFGQNIVGEYDDSIYRISKHSVSTKEDKEFRCHFVNIELIVKVLNVIQK